MMQPLAVAVAGLGSIGLRVARALDDGLPGFRLAAVASSSIDRAQAAVSGFRVPPRVRTLEDVPQEADIVIECLPPSVFPVLAEHVAAHAPSYLLVVSAGALISVSEATERLEARGVKIIVPSGAVAGLDALRAARAAGLQSVRLVTRKQPGSFGGSVIHDGVEVATTSITQPLLLFEGSAREAVTHYPKNINVAATISLAGLGADATAVEIWADPNVAGNCHELHLRSLAGESRSTAINLPDPNNPSSSAITGFSVIAALRRLNDPVSIGS